MKPDVVPILAYLDNLGVGYSQSDGGYFKAGWVSFQYTCRNAGSIDVQVHYNENCTVFTVIGIKYEALDEKNHDEVLRLANEANLRSRFSYMVVGDAQDEKFYFWCTCSNAAEDWAGDYTIDAMIRNTCDMVDQYYPAVMKINWAGITAREALDSLGPENDDEESGNPAPPIDGYQ